MDQLKVVLQHVQKHHFWILCVLCLGAGLYAWNSASGTLSKDFDSRKGTINGKFSGMDAILQEPNFPNERWEEAVKNLNDEQKKRVKTAWQKVYDEQAPFFKWPENLQEDGGTPMTEKQRGSDLSSRYLQLYQRLAKAEFPKLLAIVGATSHRDQKSTASVGDNSANMQAQVLWESANQAAIDESLQFAAKPPTSQEVWLTQENLWVYQVLLTIIQKVNADRYVPAVSRIDEILIAQQAADAFAAGLSPGRIAMPKSDGQVTPGTVSAPRPAARGQGPGGGTEVLQALDTGRYVDATGNPLQVAPGPQEPFKRMPVFMKLEIDQREIGNLLAECANSPLPVEVRQLRIDPSKSDSGSGNSNRASSQTSTTVKASSSYYVPIEIGGIIYLYNPPNTQLLGTGEENADPGAVPGG